MELWDKVSITDPTHIQLANVSGQKRKTVKAVFQKETATKTFGPQGQFWGAVPGSEDYQRVHIDNGEILLQYTGLMYYVWQGERGEVPIAAAIMERSIVKRGKPDEYIKLDHEAIKKVRTDALTKGLSELGFNADIFKGWHDQSGYSDYAQEQVSEVIAEEAEAKAISEAEQYAEWKQKELGVYASLQTVKAITTAHNGHVRKASKMGDQKGVRDFKSAMDKRIEEIKNAAV